MSDNLFKVINHCASTNARLAELALLHGTVNTPVFLPVGSQATVRSLTPDDLEEIGIKMILCNAYHLYLRPGLEVIGKAGGLHKFMGWDKPVLTDSGGYQIFSLSSFRKITDDGVMFRSHIDGSEHHITPEYAILLQEKLGADIIMTLDVCPESTTSKEHLEKAVALTTQWAKRCQQSHNDTGQHLFGIIQGGVYPELRKLSAHQVTDIDFPGYAIGGLSLGEAKPVMWDMVEHTVQFMPVSKPRYLMGVGSPEDIFEGIARGIDIFDCALPTRVARNGALFTYGGRKNIKRSTYRDVMEPVEVTCGCYTCRKFSAAYLHHLFKCEELLAYRLATIHNVFFMNNLLDNIRASLRENKFFELKNGFMNRYQTTDEDKRLEQKLRNMQGKRKTASPDF